MLVEIDIEHPVTHTHYLKWFNRIPYQMSPFNGSVITNENQITNFCLGTCYLHVVVLICIRPIDYHEYSPIHYSYLENNKMFLTYESLVVQYMYQLHLYHTLKWVLNEYLGLCRFDFSSIVRYLESLINYVFIACFMNCHFNESVFLLL